MSCRKHSCETAEQTLEWLNAIAEFLTPFKWLLNAHVVNFFQDRLWESMDQQWLDSLRKEPVENLLKIPSGIAQEYWPTSLQEFMFTLKSLTFPREPILLQEMFPGFHVPTLSTVLAQGMNLKKKHEVEVLSALVSRIADGVGSQAIIDVGAGQGYLAQVLSFQYQLSVTALDASLHHATVTSERGERIKKHYAAQSRKSQYGNKSFNMPRTVTCRIISSDTLLRAVLLHYNSMEEAKEIEKDLPILALNKRTEPPLVLAGLHACGDLSVAMLKTFVDCNDIRAVVSIGCCYNLLSEECLENSAGQSGFPMSNGVKLSGITLGKNARDLACQSAERWRNLTNEAAVQNFELHGFRAAFQMVLRNYHQEIIISSPSIGRQGKALRRKQSRKALQSQLLVKERENSPEVSPMEGCQEEQIPIVKVKEIGMVSEGCPVAEIKDHICTSSSGCAQATDGMLESNARWGIKQPFEGSDKYALFEEFCKSGLCRLGLTTPLNIDFLGIWKEALPYTELIGPFWSLRASLGPLVETFLLLDRLLFLQEQGSSIEAMMFSLFDPTISPRNVAIVAQKIVSDAVS